MSTLQRAMGEVPALRDRLDVATLNALSETCRDLDTSTRQSDAYRQRYFADNYESLRLGASFEAAPTVREPEADFKKVAYGQRVFTKRLCGLLAPTNLDLAAERYYLHVVRPGASRTVERLRRLQDTHPAPPAPMEPARKKRLIQRCVVTASVLVGAGLAAGLFLYGTTLAAIVVLSALCAAFMHWGKPLFDRP